MNTQIKKSRFLASACRKQRAFNWSFALSLLLVCTCSSENGRTTGEPSGSGGWDEGSGVTETGGISDGTSGSGFDGQDAVGQGGQGPAEQIPAGQGAAGNAGNTGSEGCGNGIIDPDEECDGVNLGNATCQSLGMGSGQLLCDSSCLYDLSGCTVTTNDGGGNYGNAGNTVPSGGTGGTEQPVAGQGQPPITGESCLLPGDGTYGEPGPYKVGQMDVALGTGDICPDMGTNMYTIFYPDPLDVNCKHPIAAWGNGTGVTGSLTYDFFNRNAAAWGIVVAAAHDSNTGCGNYHKVGIDYLLAENENPNSMFYQKLSSRAGTGGHSQGGMGATAGSSHPNVVAEACVAGGGLLEPKVAFMCLTGSEDFVNGPCTATYNAAPGPAFLADWEGGDHIVTETMAGYIARDPGTLQMQRLYAAWFRCFLADDPVACAMFKGSPCGICNEPGWANIGGRNM